MWQRLLVLIFIAALASESSAQLWCDSLQAVAPERYIVATPVPPDSSDVRRLSHKSFWRATAETAGFNIGLWAFDRYVQKGHYAYISWQTIKENFRHGFEWDNDHLGTNMFAHPYNGSLFFNAGRSNGFNFWQSELFAIGGSAMWEMFMEKEYPSTNDIIATPIGGAAIGEVLYRTSDIVLDDRTQGWGRFGRELAAFVISPMRGFTRLVTGRAWQRRATTGRRFGTPPVSVSFGLGSRVLVYHDNDNVNKGGLAATIAIEYGDRYTESDCAPYDYFSFFTELNAIKTQPLLSRMEIIGRLLSRELIDAPSCRLSLGMYQHFDYFDSDTISSQIADPYLPPCVVPYKFGSPASLGAGAMLRYAPSPQHTINAHLHANAVILGGILTDFYRYYNRNYNWGSGFSLKFGAEWLLAKNNIIISATDRMYRLYTWRGSNSDAVQTPTEKPLNIQGDVSASTFNHLDISIGCRIWQQLYLNTSVNWYHRNSRYDKYMEWIVDGTYASTSEVIATADQWGLNLMLVYKL